MTRSEKIRGTVVPMISPFTADRELDGEAAARLVDRLAQNKLGAFVLGTTGEAASIPGRMRRELVAIAVQAAEGRVPVFAGIGENCVLESIAAAREYLKQGVDAVVAHLPSYYLLKPDEMIAYFRLLCQEIDGPIMIYNIPQATRMSIPVEVVEALASEKCIIGFKDSEATPGRLELVAPLAQRDDFSVFMGAARLSVEALKAGFDGLVPSSGNLEPALWHQLETLAAQGDWEGAKACQDQLDHLSLVYQENRTLGQSLAALKAAMCVDGLCQPYVLPPLLTLEGAERDTVVQALAARRQCPNPV
ncbi:MAG: dihydrodipicolinate synthase family protein [Verrucomicrobiota bacterium JB022]|nr:dihydrodipicolinate synthase family protein [Verrucomicrobiota bacterium JB022]